MISLLSGFLFSFLIAAFAYQKRSLSKSGAVAAIVVGTNVYAFGSLFWYGLLLTFFISSSALSRLKKQKKDVVAKDLFEKTGQRDVMQVLANGGLGTLFVWFAAASMDTLPWMVAYVGVIAAVNADTWGTELGVLSRGKPRHILTGRLVEKGTSGGISVWGTLGTALGGLWIGLFASLFQLILAENGWQLFWLWIGLLSGLLGALIDSVLGATVQLMYGCSICGGETERCEHCGAKTRRIRGVGGCNNDAVNLLSSAAGGLIAWLCWRVIGF
nr:DUF92 domain-containing protein [Ammoniphilus oxalaticus]